MVKVLSLFSGIGAFEKALKRIGVDYELVNYCEIDKYASKSYAAIHNVDENMNLGDITKIDTNMLPNDIDLITYGFPCQDISIAGKQKGLLNEDGTKTRSGLFFEALRIIEETQPKVAIAENVKNLTGRKFKEQFEIVLNSLEQIGYNNYWEVLNAKDYGIPQNRERVIIVSIRKDVDDGNFKFPNGFPLNLRLIDLLDEEVDDKYYVKSKRIDIIQKNLGDVFKDNFIIGSSQKNAFVGDETICPSLTSAMGSGGGQTPMIRTNEKIITKPVLVGGIGERNFGSQYRQGNRIYDSKAIAVTLCASPVGNTGGNSYLYQLDNLKIRKLTPKECFRLMGFDDNDYENAAKVNSNTQLYKQSGNSIVVNVLEAIFEELKKYWN